MKKNQPRHPQPRPQQVAAGGKHEAAPKKVGVVSGTPADSFDEAEEHRHDKRVAVYIALLAVLLAIAATGSNDAMKHAQQAGFQVNDQYAFYQSKYIRQGQLKLAVDQLQLRLDETPGAALTDEARKRIEAKKDEYDKEAARLETNARNGKKELLAKAEACENERNLALAQHPFYDYSMATMQIAIVLASASIIMGAPFLLYGSFGVGALGILLFLNGYTLFYGAPDLKHDKAAALEKAGVQISLKCSDE